MLKAARTRRNTQGRVGAVKKKENERKEFVGANILCVLEGKFGAMLLSCFKLFVLFTTIGSKLVN